MAKKKTPPEPKNDFAPKEELDLCGFSDNPIILGECIASFSFDDDSANESNRSTTTSQLNPITSSESASSKTIDFNNFNNNSLADINNSTHKIFDNITTNTSTESILQIKAPSNSENILADNRKAPIVNGCAPPIDGEYLDRKRTYMLRSSTVRKLNELKSINHDLNTYVSTIVDLAIAHYYDHIVNDGFAVAVSAYLLIRLEKQINTLSGSINKLNTIISRKLGVVIDNDVSGDNSHKVDQKKAINIFFKMFIAFNFVYILGSFRLNY